MKGPKAILALADGTVFEGTAFGAKGEVTGEVVFNTSMTGYQEIYSDPSYKGQIVTLTYTQIGNYGVNDEDFESDRLQAEGVIVREYFETPSNFRSQRSLGELLAERGVVGIEGIDTRKLVRHIRDAGAQMGVLSTEDLDPKSLVEKAKNAPGLVGRDLVKEVTCEKPYEWTEGTWKLGEGYTKPASLKHHVVAMDFGIKRNILRNLVDVGCKVTVVPATASAEDVLAYNPDGIFLSNGPGDPEGVPYAAETVAKLIGKKPIFGICLGHQILSLSL
ncbi:MAG: glutamine-hydrolyzing carbamoyl-phosphate synthase small subunit, partial [Chrysiogenetes bacterium]|nr:glutamine-hydrolyzing carbamoyl-phosphate synthase small subunit [Chrysiogenetes bacterium]